MTHPASTGENRGRGEAEHTCRPWVSELRAGQKQRWASHAGKASPAMGCKNPTLKNLYLPHAGEKVGRGAMPGRGGGGEESAGSMNSALTNSTRQPATTHAAHPTRPTALPHGPRRPCTPLTTLKTRYGAPKHHLHAHLSPGRPLFSCTAARSTPSTTRGPHHHHHRPAPSLPPALPPAMPPLPPPLPPTYS